MPIYEYRCTKCGHLIEIIQKLSDRPLRKCPECAGRLEKLVSRASFQLKGGGWYSEGYTSSGDRSSGDRSSGDKSSGDKSSGDKSSGDKKTTTKTDPPAKSTKKDSPSSKSS